MPRWALNSVWLAGPAHEVQRLRKTCIRQIMDEGDIGFDFESLLPMPAVIRATRKDQSDEARTAAVEATGCADRPSWCAEHWGTRRNSSNFREFDSDPETLRFVFMTAHSFPEPVFAALAQQFPRLWGRVVSFGRDHGWAAFGYLTNGQFVGGYGDIAQELDFLASTNDRSPAVRRLTAMAMADLAVSHESSSSSLARLSREDVWQTAAQHLKAALARRLAFRFVLDDVIASYEDDESSLDSGTDREKLRALDSIISSRAILTFLGANGRCFSSLDRDLLVTLAAHLEDTFQTDLAENELDLEFRRSAAMLLVDFPEDELWEWAAHAVFRSSTRLNLGDLGTLQTSFVEYASCLRHQTLAFLASQDTDLRRAA
jgi:hypothetical protein